MTHHPMNQLYLSEPKKGSVIRNSIISPIIILEMLYLIIKRYLCNPLGVEHSTVAPLTAHFERMEVTIRSGKALMSELIDCLRSVTSVWSLTMVFAIVKCGGIPVARIAVFSHCVKPVSTALKCISCMFSLHNLLRNNGWVGGRLVSTNSYGV